MKNFRPVSNLSFMSKLLEKVVHTRLVGHLEREGLMPSNQSGYRQNHSTETAMLRIFNDLVSAVDYQEALGVMPVGPIGSVRHCRSCHHAVQTRKNVWYQWQGTSMAACISRGSHTMRQVWRKVFYTSDSPSWCAARRSAWAVAICTLHSATG